MKSCSTCFSCINITFRIFYRLSQRISWIESLVSHSIFNKGGKNFKIDIFVDALWIKFWTKRKFELSIDYSSTYYEWIYICVHIWQLTRCAHFWHGFCCAIESSEPLIIHNVIGCNCYSTFNIDFQGVPCID